MKHKRSAMRGSVAAGVFVVAVLSGASALAAPSGWLALNASIRATGGAVDWANSGAAGGTPCTNGGVDVTGANGLFNCGVFNGVSTPPTAPLRVSSDPSIISTVFIADPLSSDDTTCPSGSGKGDPTTVQGGTNDDALNSYTITTGSVPPKDELENVYAVSRTRADGHPELYFAAERATNNGDSHIDFEFLQSVVTRTAACGGTFTGNRTQGDLLIAADFSNGGQVATPSVWQWQCSPVQPDGTVCNPGSGAAYLQIAVPPANIPFLINDLAATPCGGWACRDQSGVLIANVPQFDFVEGGINLQDLGFTGCFNTFLPHTRTSNPFTAQLADFIGPQAFASCRTPVTNSSPGGSVASGTAVRDVADLTNDGAAVKPGGTLTFFLCQPAQVTASGCLGGTQVGAPKTLVNGIATSDPSSATNTSGKYCWRTVYTPDLASLGIYTPGSHTNATTECFNVAAPVNLPNTGLPDIRFNLWPSLPGLLIAPALLLSLAWRRSRSLAVLLIAVVVAGSSPAPAPSAAPPPARDTAVAQSGAQVGEGASPLELPTVKAKAMGWRLVIPRIGVDALIQSVGRDSHGAMASPSGLDSVAWFNRGPVPGHPGDAVIDGHYGDSNQAGVFRKLHWLRPGDEIQVVWPDGRTVFFEVATSEVVAANAHPAGVFARTGPARISLITCTGVWDQSHRTYSDRLIVTAMLS